MRCPLCGARIDGWCKTVRDREGDRSGLVIVPGPVVVWGKCLLCGSWENPRELVDVKPGAAGRGDAPGGTCGSCATG